MINVCIFGAGAIGGYIGCSLSKAGANVSLIARGPHKEAIKKNVKVLCYDCKFSNKGIEINKKINLLNE